MAQFESKPIPELGNRTWEELELVNDELGYVLFRDEIRRRTTDGWKSEPVRVRIIRPVDIAKARGETRILCAKLKVDLDRDKDLFEELEQLVLLSKAIRTAQEPHSQFADAEELGEHFDEGSLQDLLGRIRVYRQLVDPREPVLSEEQIWTRIAAVVRCRHLGPLTDIAGHEQPSLLLFMAEQALSSPRALSYLRSLATSTQAASSQPSSDGSSEGSTGSS
jgi:hypothetical protein